MQKFCLLFLVFFLCGCLTTSSSPSINGVHAQPKILSTGKREVIATNISYDPKTGVMKYTLPEASWVRIRVGLNERGALLCPLIDWERREAGEHKEMWNFKDTSGKIDFKDYQNIIIVIACIAVDETKPVTVPSTIKGFRHSPRFDITFPGSVEKNSEGYPILRDVVPVRVTINPEDHQWLLASRFELIGYIDFAFMVEDEEGNNPYNFMFNTKGLNEGEHILTVNVAGFDGEIGTSSVRVVVKK